jgi:DNA-binding NtrC family response regulator
LTLSDGSAAEVEKMTSPFEVVVLSSDLAFRRHLAEILAKLGLDPVRLSTLRECHEVLAQKRVGLVFCDRHVADGNYQDLLAAYPIAGDRPRVVVTSGTADWDEYKEAMRCGAFDVISVPCRHTDVEWMVIQAKRADRRAEGPAPVRIAPPELAKAAGASARSGTTSRASHNK